MVEYAKKIFDIDRGWIEDRTKVYHKYPIDVDVKKPSAPPEKRHWIYWGSHRSLEQAEKSVKKTKETLLTQIGRDVQVRFVEADTGKVLKKLKDIVEL